MHLLHCLFNVMVLFICSIKGQEGGGQQTSIFRIDKTLAVVSHVVSTVTECRIYDTDKHADTAQHDILSLGQPVTDIQLHEMLNLINKCRALDIENFKNNSVPEDTTANALGDEFSAREMQDHTMAANFTEVLSLWRGIVPGTKWCGPGDDAINYADLGPKVMVDTCCRAHDLCPIRLRPFRMGYGMVNFSVYTKSHCSCDDVFQRCLKEAHTPLGDWIGHMYFNVLKFGCLEEHVDQQEDAGNGIMSRAFAAPASSFSRRLLLRQPHQSRLRVSYKRNATY